MSRPTLMRLAALLAALTLGLATTLVSPTPADAASSCWAATCNGRDPQNQGCSPGSYNLDEFSYAGVRFELRYSPRCQATWTRVTSPQHFNTLFGQIRGGGHVHGVQATQGQHWTRMISFNNRVRACQAVWFDARPGSCTVQH